MVALTDYSDKSRRVALKSGFSSASSPIKKEHRWIILALIIVFLVALTWALETQWLNQINSQLASSGALQIFGAVSLQYIMGAILNICAIVWLIGEIAIWRGDKQSSGGSERQDKGSRSYAIIAVIIGMGASSVASTFMPFLGIYRLAFFVLGIATMVAGIALRRWAVVTLGRFFNSKVVIQEGHKVVDSGPYRYVRNPSYTGLIITAVGYGIGCGSMVSIAIMFIVPLIGIVNRIFVEEEALLKGLGEDYTLYMKKVRYRLFPYIW